MKTQIDRGTWTLAIGAVAAIAVYVTVVFLPEQCSIRKLSSDLTTKETYVQRAGNLGAILETAQRDFESAKAYNAAWQEHAPNGKELAELFGHVSALAKSAGMTTTRFDPEPIVACDKVRKIPLTMGCQGTFAQVRKFLFDLDSLPEAIWVEHVTIDKIPQDSKDVQVEISMVIFTDNPVSSDQVDRSG